MTMMMKRLIAICAALFLIVAPAAHAQTSAQVHPLFETALNRMPPGWPMVFRVPSSQVVLFDGLMLMSSKAAADDWRAPGTPMYEIGLGRLGEGMPTALFKGYMGPAMYLQSSDTQAQLSQGCWPGAPYCGFAGVGDRITSEGFYNLSISGSPASISHTVCCNGEYWTATWFDPSANVSYSIELSLGMAKRIGASGVSSENALYAQQIADFATALIPVKR